MAGRLALLLVLALLLQTVVATRLTVLGVTADIFLVVVIVVSLGRGSLTGAVFGFVSGLVADIVFLEPVGLRALTYLVAGYAVGRYGEEYPPESGWTVLLSALVVGFVAGTAHTLFAFLTGEQLPFFSMLASQVLPAAMLEALLAAPTYVGLQRVGVLPVPAAPRASLR